MSPYACPYATLIRSRTRLLGRPYEAVAKRFLGAAYFSAKAWASEHPDPVRRFAAAMRESSAWGNANPQKSAVILEKYTRVDPETVAAMTRTVYGEALVEAEIQPTIDFGVRYNFLDGRFSAQELIYHS